MASSHDLLVATRSRLRQQSLGGPKGEEGRKEKEREKEKEKEGEKGRGEGKKKREREGRRRRKRREAVVARGSERREQGR